MFIKYIFIITVSFFMLIRFVHHILIISGVKKMQDLIGYVLLKHVINVKVCVCVCMQIRGRGIINEQTCQAVNESSAQTCPCCRSGHVRNFSCASCHSQLLPLYPISGQSGLVKSLCRHSLQI